MPPAVAPPPSTVKWDYKTVTIENDEVQTSSRFLSKSDYDHATFTDHQAGDFFDAFYMKTPSEIDKAGQDGWELVSAVPLLQTHDGFTRTEKIFLIF